MMYVIFMSEPLCHSVKIGIFASVADVCSVFYSGIDHKILEWSDFYQNYHHNSVSLTSI